MMYDYQQEFKDTTGVIRIRNSKDRPHNGQMFEDTTGVIRIRKSKELQIDCYVGL